jgi:phage FluMu protein gp41
MHKRGIMRLATAADEILPMRDPRVQQNPSYLSVILLSRVITKLGEVGHIDTKVIERLFTADLAYLQDLYQRINQMEAPSYPAICPKCGHEHDIPVDFFNLRG